MTDTPIPLVSIGRTGTFANTDAPLPTAADSLTLRYTSPYKFFPTDDPRKGYFVITDQVTGRPRALKGITEMLKAAQWPEYDYQTCIQEARQLRKREAAMGIERPKFSIDGHTKDKDQKGAITGYERGELVDYHVRSLIQKKGIKGFPVYAQDKHTFALMKQAGMEPTRHRLRCAHPLAQAFIRFMLSRTTPVQSATAVSLPHHVDDDKDHKDTNNNVNGNDDDDDDEPSTIVPNSGRYFPTGANVAAGSDEHGMCTGIDSTWCFVYTRFYPRQARYKICREELFVELTAYESAWQLSNDKMQPPYQDRDNSPCNQKQVQLALTRFLAYKTLDRYPKGAAVIRMCNANLRYPNPDEPDVYPLEQWAIDGIPELLSRLERLRNHIDMRLAHRLSIAKIKAAKEKKMEERRQRKIEEQKEQAQEAKQREREQAKRNKKKRKRQDSDEESETASESDSDSDSHRSQGKRQTKRSNKKSSSSRQKKKSRSSRRLDSDQDDSDDANGDTSDEEKAADLDQQMAEAADRVLDRREQRLASIASSSSSSASSSSRPVVVSMSRFVRV